MMYYNFSSSIRQPVQQLTKVWSTNRSKIDVDGKKHTTESVPLIVLHSIIWELLKIRISIRNKESHDCQYASKSFYPIWNRLNVAYKNNSTPFKNRINPKNQYELKKCKDFWSRDKSYPSSNLLVFVTQ